MPIMSNTLLLCYNILDVLVQCPSGRGGIHPDIPPSRSAPECLIHPAYKNTRVYVSAWCVGVEGIIL